MREIAVYTDGSYTVSYPGISGYGLVCVENEKVVDELSFGKRTELADKYRNVLGELYGAMQAVLYATEHNYDSVVIYADYQGVKSWYEGGWKTKNEVTMKYKTWMKMKSREINIKIEWVRGHDGNEFNEMADRLAKKGIKDLIDK